MDLIALFGNEINGIPYVGISVKVGMPHESRVVAETSIRRWLEQQFRAEWDRQRQQAVSTDLKEELGFGLDFPDLTIAPESTREYLRPTEEEQASPAPGFGPTPAEVDAAMQETLARPDPWVEQRRQKADCWVTADGKTYDRKPTLFVRMFRKPTKAGAR